MQYALQPEMLVVDSLLHVLSLTNPAPVKAILTNWRVSLLLSSCRKHITSGLDDQNIITSRIAKLEQANRNYYQEGLSFLELAQSAHSLYKLRQPVEQASLLRTILSNCEIKGLTLYPTYRKPFNYFVETP